MKSGKCPKCGGGDVRLQQGKSLCMSFTPFTEVRQWNYICGQCGYVESYVVDLAAVRENLPLVKAKG
jgi:predicted nucleic-acid-binding Zn-ribbon protein